MVMKPSNEYYHPTLAYFSPKKTFYYSRVCTYNVYLVKKVFQVRHKNVPERSNSYNNKFRKIEQYLQVPKTKLCILQRVFLIFGSNNK